MRWMAKAGVAAEAQVPNPEGSGFNTPLDHKLEEEIILSSGPAVSNQNEEEDQKTSFSSSRFPDPNTGGNTNAKLSRRSLYGKYQGCRAEVEGKVKGNGQGERTGEAEKRKTLRGQSRC
jgi:hypothetical protein